jgi:amino acid adenylation domain-containing protein
LEAAFPEQAEWLAALATPWVASRATAGVPASPLVIELEDAATFAVWVEADDGRAAAVARHLAAWLSNLVDLDRTLEEVDWVRGEERALLIDTLNDTERPYPQDGSIHGLFASQVRARGGAVAISVAGAGGGSDVTYAELERRANRLAHDLCQQGVGRDDRVGLVAERSVEFIVSALAILKAGASYVPFDPEEPSERSSAMIAAARLRALLVPCAGALRQPLPGVPIIDLSRRAELIARQPDHAPETDAVAEQLAYVMFTSGSTGTPKGVAVSHRAVLRLVCGVDYVRLGPSDVLLQAASCCFDASTFELWGALLNGARLVVLPAPRPTLDAIADTIQRERVTTAFLTTGLFHLMAVERPAALQALDQILTGGEVSSVSLVRQVRDTVRGAVLHVYGPTESTTFATCHRVSRDERLDSNVPLGRPIANTRVYLLDDDLRLVPFGIPGEICIGGDGLARGYEGEAALTAERFVPDPFASGGGGRLYRTGDMARHDEDGLLEFLGRRDRQVKIRGFRIELAEVEHALSRHPAVASAAVVPIDDGRGVKRLVAYLANRGGAVDEKEFGAWLARCVPAYMVPSQVRWGDRLPLTRNGKVDYRELAFRFADGEADAGQGEPHTEVQRVLVAVWREILGVERVGIDDDFFALGGDSMLAIQMLARLHARGSSFEIQEIFEHSTIRTLAEHVVSAEPPAPSTPPSRGYCLTEVDRARLPPDIESAYPLSRLQAGTLFHTRDGSSPNASTQSSSASRCCEPALISPRLASLCSWSSG